MKRKLVIAIAISVLVGTLFSTMAAAGVFGTAAIRFSDALYAGHPPLKNIAIVAIDDESLQRIGRWPWNRSVFADILRRLDSAAVIGIDVSFFEPSDASEDAKLQAAIFSGNVVLASEIKEFETTGGELRAKKTLLPIFNTSHGHTNVFQDFDGIVRSFPSRIGNVEAFSVEIVEKWLGTDISVPHQRAIINFAGPPGTYSTYSFADIYDGSLPAEEFEDKIVLIGATARDLHDEQLVPITHGAMPGVEIHANAVQTIITQSYLVYQHTHSVAAVIFLLCILAGLVLYRLKLAVATMTCFALLAALVLASFLAFDNGLIMNLFHPIAALAGTYVANVGFFYVTESRQRKYVTSLFGKYVSADVVAELLKNPEQIKLGGKRKELTILFSDIRGFTSLSERIKPEELVHFLNKYLTAMSDIIMKNRGTVDKYIGDAIMAFWGAPLDDPEHARMACATAVEMIEELHELRKKWKKKGVNIAIGIGINSGEAVVGNMGSEQRFSYTAMGDNVNLASRLEGLNKEYATNILISEATFDRVKDAFFTREVDLVRVKGRRQPVRIFEVMAKAGEESVKQQKIKGHFENGLGHYRKKKWDAAMREFAKAARLGDATSEKFMERCKALAKERLPNDWSGVFEAKMK